jgi:hypothetical protein
MPYNLSVFDINLVVSNLLNTFFCRLKFGDHALYTVLATTLKLSAVMASMVSITF